MIILWLNQLLFIWAGNVSFIFLALHSELQCYTLYYVFRIESCHFLSFDIFM